MLQIISVMLFVGLLSSCAPQQQAGPDLSSEQLARLEAERKAALAAAAKAKAEADAARVEAAKSREEAARARKFLRQM
ncbi:MAG: hypothetical protein HQL88_11000 [Magnetococcales bacterium]|nr:hypothetical protein [Magnetococcales bacterium]